MNTRSNNDVIMVRVKEGSWLYAHLTAEKERGVPYAVTINTYAPVENKSAAVDEQALKRVVREELDAALAGLQLARLSAQEIDDLETEVAAAALDGGAAWD